MKETEDIFFGRLAWAGVVEWARDNATADGEWFRLWEELSNKEQERYIRIGVGIATYVRNTESSAVLKQELQTTKANFEAVTTNARKEHKARGGR